MALCGDAGDIRADGRPCEQDVRPGQLCIHHRPGTTADDRRMLALRGAAASRLKSIAVLSADTASPVLDNPAGVRALLAETVQAARTGQLDHRVAAVVINGARAAIELAQLVVASQIGDLERRFKVRR